MNYEENYLRLILILGLVTRKDIEFLSNLGIFQQYECCACGKNHTYSSSLTCCKTACNEQELKILKQEVKKYLLENYQIENL